MAYKIIRERGYQSLAKWAGLKIRFRRNPRVQIPSLALEHHVQIGFIKFIHLRIIYVFISLIQLR